MKFSKLIKKLNNLDTGIPARFSHPGLTGSFYMRKGGAFTFLETETMKRIPDALTLSDMLRKDWFMSTR